jgi:hypothetical protein
LDFSFLSFKNLPYILCEAHANNKIYWFSAHCGNGVAPILPIAGEAIKAGEKKLFSGNSEAAISIKKHQSYFLCICSYIM